MRPDRVNSEFTAGEVVELLGVPRERICVAYPGVGAPFRPDGPSRDLGGPYVFTVATPSGARTSRRARTGAGFFLVTYREDDHHEAGISEDFVQHNHSRSTQGIVRGMHF